MRKINKKEFASLFASTPPCERLLLLSSFCLPNLPHDQKENKNKKDERDWTGQKDDDGRNRWCELWPGCWPLPIGETTKTAAKITGHEFIKNGRAGGQAEEIEFGNIFQLPPVPFTKKKKRKIYRHTYPCVRECVCVWSELPAPPYPLLLFLLLLLFFQSCCAL